MSLRARALDHFVEPRTAPPRRDADAPRPVPPRRNADASRPVPPRRDADARGGYLAPVAPPVSHGRVAATRLPLRAAVLGSVAEAVPVGALLANALRCAAGAPTAALAVWAPGAAGLRSGLATPAAARLASRLNLRGQPAVSRGRLAWLALDAHPVAAAVAARRATGAFEVPFVVVLAGPRCDVIEGVLAEQDLVVVVAAEPAGPLARLAVAGCAGPALACAPPAPGLARWAARSGLGTRGLAAPLRSLVRELVPVTRRDQPVEVAW